MKVKNISKKIMGNADFRLLPGDEMTVTGKELWVVNNLKRGKLEKVTTKKSKTAAAATEVTAAEE